MSLLDNKEAEIKNSVGELKISNDALNAKITVTGLYAEPKTLGEGLFSDEELGVKKIGLSKDRKQELVETIVSAIINSDAYNDRIEQRGDADTGILLVTYDEELLTELKDVMHSYKDVIISTDELSKAVVEAIADDKTDLAVEPNVKVDTDESRSVFVDPRLLTIKDASSGKLALAYSVVETKPVESLTNAELTEKVALLQSEITQLMADVHGSSETETDTVTNPESVTETETETDTVTNPESATETETVTSLEPVTETEADTVTNPESATETDTTTNPQSYGDAVSYSGVASESASEYTPSSEIGVESSSAATDNQE